MIMGTAKMLQAGQAGNEPASTILWSSTLDLAMNDECSVWSNNLSFSLIWLPLPIGLFHRKVVEAGFEPALSHRRIWVSFMLSLNLYSYDPF